MIKRILNYKVGGVFTIYFWLMAVLWLIGVIIRICGEPTGTILAAIGDIGMIIWFIYFWIYNCKFIWFRRLKVKYYTWRNQPVKVRLEIYKLVKKYPNEYKRGICIALTRQYYTFFKKIPKNINSIFSEFDKFNPHKCEGNLDYALYWWPYGELEPRQKALDECIRMCKEKIKNKQYE